MGGGEGISDDVSSPSQIFCSVVTMLKKCDSASGWLFHQMGKIYCQETGKNLVKLGIITGNILKRKRAILPATPQYSE
jgi:hypothetical protein